MTIPSLAAKKAKTMLMKCCSFAVRASQSRESCSVKLTRLTFC